MEHASEPSAFERASAPVLVRLAAVPRWTFVIALAAFVAAGLLLPGWLGAVILLLLAVLLGWLAALGWRRLAPAGALVRVVTVALVLWAAVSKVR